MYLEMAHKVILPPKKNYIPQFLKQRDIKSYCHCVVTNDQLAMLTFLSDLCGGKESSTGEQLVLLCSEFYLLGLKFEMRPVFQSLICCLSHFSRPDTIEASVENILDSLH